MSVSLMAPTDSYTFTVGKLGVYILNIQKTYP